MADLPIRRAVPLAPLTTLELGGPAEHFVEADDVPTVTSALRWAAARGMPATLLGGGSNVVVPDAGVAGLVVRLGLRGVAMRRDGDRVLVTAAAGEPWDALVARTVDAGLAGLECLSGIPGLVGATPIQNVGAYGQEVAETLARVRVLDRRTLEVHDLGPSECGFAYRDSRFKREPGRHAVLEVTFALVPGGAPAVRYAELERALEEAGDEAPTLAAVRDTVLRLRRAKGMVIDPDDANRRSAGSFFTNPVVSDAEAARVVERALALGVARDPSEVPRWPAGGGRTKLAAGWLIERAGIAKGHRQGHVGVSSRHALALVHHGGGTTDELLALARRVRDTVHARFGVTLVPEPVLLGATDPLWSRETLAKNDGASL
ncbi:MAG: UDP-N-acetylmuramate dehydrogenase [Myxococcota bacterium]